MSVIFLLARIFLGAVLAYQGVKFLDPYARHVSIGDLRRARVEGSHLTFVSAGLVMLIGGLCIITGIGAGVGIAIAIACLIFTALATHQFRRNVMLASGAALMLLVPTPWPHSMIG